MNTLTTLIPIPQPTAPIDRFRGEYRFLSNFWPAQVQFEGITYPTVENAYQAAKTLDPDERMVIRDVTPGMAKKMGGLLEIRGDWESLRLSVMLELLRRKFQVEPLKSQLLRTGDRELIEGNDWGDRFWGVCSGTGENHLGKLLMQVRSNLREGIW